MYRPLACNTSADSSQATALALQCLACFSEHMKSVQVLQLLFSSCETEEECRNVVAECLGHLVIALSKQDVTPAAATMSGARPRRQ